MDKKYITLFVRVALKFHEELNLDLIPSQNGVISELKKIYAFESVEINKDEINFLKGFPILRISIKKDKLYVVCANNQEIEPCDEIDNLSKNIKEFLNIEYSDLMEYEFINIFNPKNKCMESFFEKCSLNELGNIAYAQASLNIKDTCKEFQISVLNGELSGYLNIKLESNIELKNNTQIIDLLKKEKLYLRAKLNTFLQSKINT